MYDGYQHLDILVAVVSLAIHDGHGVNGLAHYTVADFLALVGEDDKLRVLSGAVDQQVKGIGVDSQSHITKHHHPPVLEDGPAGPYHHQVQVEHDSSERDIAVLVDQCRYDIPATRASSCQEDDAYAQAIQYGAQHTGHGVLTFAQDLHEVSLLVCHHLLSHTQECGECQHGVCRLGHKLPSQGLDGYQEQHSIDNQQTYADGELGQVIHDGQQAWDTSCGDMIWEQEGRPSQ